MENKNLGFRWCLSLGAIGFLIGFFGPMLLTPDANQGPMVGIFITGPLGFLIGFPLWALSSRFKWNFNLQKKVVIGGGITMALVCAGALLWPKPEWVGRFYEIEVTACSASTNTDESILQANVLQERIIKKEKPPFKPSHMIAFPISSRKPMSNSFYISGSCLNFPNGFKKTYFVTDHPAQQRNLATLQPIPEELSGL